MIVIPAIDLKDGKCVRLKQGRADKTTVYSDDPAEMARRWAGEGAVYLHVVDLDGAFGGRPAHPEVIAEIAGAVDIPVEVGGGLRTDEDVKAVLDHGVARAIVGTRALEDPECIAALAGQFGDRLAVGIDARHGIVQTKGWVETSEVTAVDLAAKASAAGVSTIIYTDTSRDGMLMGTNTAAVAEVCDVANCDVVAAGGITNADDIRALQALDMSNLVGAIVGKALYEGSTTLAELHEALK
ncbi:1-(5-phosphoribosyl)-5-[(5-phosphoribosylamino)methylideneamino]imidazole-4-carboxamide isomerase [Verrucomicrobiota bacterium]